MAVNFAYEYKKFEEQQARLRKEYKEQIAMMYKFDKAQLARDLAYKRRTQSLFTESDDFESETQSALFDKFMDAPDTIEQNEDKLLIASFVLTIEDAKKYMYSIDTKKRVHRWKNITVNLYT